MIIDIAPFQMFCKIKREKDSIDNECAKLISNQ